MSKTDLVCFIAEETGLSKADATRRYNERNHRRIKKWR